MIDKNQRLPIDLATSFNAVNQNLLYLTHQSVIVQINVGFHNTNLLSPRKQKMNKALSYNQFLSGN